MDNDFLYDLLAKTSLLLQDGDRRFFQGFGLSQARYYALLHVQKDPGISLTELSRRLLCTKGNTTRILASLTEGGLLSRTVDPQDQRAYHLEISARGQELFDQVRAAYQHFNQERFTALTDRQKRMLLDQLQILNDDLVRQLQ